MAPEEPGNLVVLDVRLDEANLKAHVERFHAGTTLRVLWQASHPPAAGYVPAGGGVVFVSSEPSENYKADLGRFPGRFSWTNPVAHGGLMVVVVLPAGYVLPRMEAADPLPFESKPFGDDRMAFFWFIPFAQDRRVEVSWEMEPLASRELGAHSAALNDAARRARRSAASVGRVTPGSVMIDLPWVISVHGIRTRGKWQKDLTPALNRAGFAHTPLDFDFFRAAQLLSPAARRKKVEWFRDEYTRVAEKANRPSVIAHSFGTYLVATALNRYPEVRFDRIILCGSIVPANFPWTRMFENGQAGRVLNDYGRQDLCARLGPCGAIARVGAARKALAVATPPLRPGPATDLGVLSVQRTRSVQNPRLGITVDFAGPVKSERGKQLRLGHLLRRARVESERRARGRES